MYWQFENNRLPFMWENKSYVIFGGKTKTNWTLITAPLSTYNNRNLRHHPDDPISWHKILLRSVKPFRMITNKNYTISFQFTSLYIVRALCLWHNLCVFFCYRTVKTLVHTLVKIKGSSIVNHLTQIPDVNESDLYPYLHKVLKVRKCYLY